MHKVFQIVVVASIVCFVFLQAFVFRAPNNFPSETFLTIERGATLKATVADFEKRGLVRSAFFFAAVRDFAARRRRSRRRRLCF